MFEGERERSDRIKAEFFIETDRAFVRADDEIELNSLKPRSTALRKECSSTRVQLPCLIIGAENAAIFFDDESFVLRPIPISESVGPSLSDASG